MTKKRVNGVLMDMTEAEEAQHLLDIDIDQANRAERAQNAVDKANAKTKLKAAEYTPLTDAEIDAIIK